jgi:hypothetical protein
LDSLRQLSRWAWSLISPSGKARCQLRFFGTFLPFLRALIAREHAHWNAMIHDADIQMN